MSTPKLSSLRATIVLLGLVTGLGASALGCDDKPAADAKPDAKPAAPPELSPQQCQDFAISWVAPLVGTGLDEAGAAKMAHKLAGECEQHKQDEAWVKFATCINEKSVIDRADCFSLKPKDFPL
jgi:hypothetical protein